MSDDSRDTRSERVRRLANWVVLLHVKDWNSQDRYYTLPLNVLDDFRRVVTVTHPTHPVVTSANCIQPWADHSAATRTNSTHFVDNQNRPVVVQYWWDWLMERTGGPRFAENLAFEQNYDRAATRPVRASSFATERHKPVQMIDIEECQRWNVELPDRSDWFDFDYLNPLESVNKWIPRIAFAKHTGQIAYTDEGAVIGSATPEHVHAAATPKPGFSLFCRLQRHVITDDGNFIPAGTPVKVLGWSEDDKWGDYTLPPGIDRVGRTGQFDNKSIEVQTVAYMYVDMENTDERGTVGSGLHFAVRPDNLVYDEIRSSAD